MKDLLKKIKTPLPYLMALIAGGIFVYGFSPYNIGIAPIASCAILLWCLEKKSAKSAFYLGWIYGITLFATTVYWVYVSIHDFGNASPMLAGFITGVFVILMGLYFAHMTCLLNAFFPQNNNIRLFVVFPALWVLFEIIRGYAFTGFPWAFVGYSQMGNHLRNFAPIGGVWAVSWVALIVASLLYAIFDYYLKISENKKRRNLLLVSMVVVWGIAFGLNQIYWTKPSDHKLKVALVQGNIAQLMRWDPQYIASIVEIYQNLTATALNHDLIVWPEGAIPVPLPLSQHFFVEEAEIIGPQRSALISGVPTLLDNQKQYYNSLLAVGDGSGIYYKTKLVPFGEYVPFEKYLRGLIGFFNLPMSSFVSGPSHQPPLIAKGFRFAPLICYEIAYPEYVRQMSTNADFILTVSNDTWFGKSIGPAQHLQIAQFRAIETGRYVIRATNTGFTALISPNGEIDDILEQFEAKVLSGEVTPMVGQTFWVRYGLLPLLIALIVVLAGGLAVQTYRSTHPKKK